MTNQEKIILKKILKKVNKNGFDCELGIRGNIVKIFRGKDETNEMSTILEFILSHEFCKAFFGEEDSEYIIRTDGGKLSTQPFRTIKIWEHHLQQLSLCETLGDKFEYLRKFS